MKRRKLLWIVMVIAMLSLVLLFAACSRNTEETEESTRFGAQMNGSDGTSEEATTEAVTETTAAGTGTASGTTETRTVEAPTADVNDPDSYPWLPLP